ncbi:MAG TPA: DUF1629 domain-containing protein [Burkholderiales bacterium]
MALPEGFGDFWPLGDFDGWRDRLNGFYFSQTPEGKRELYEPRDEVSYSYYVNQKFSNEAGSGEGLYQPPLSPIKSHEPPMVFRTEKTYRALASLIMFNDSIIAVDEKLKSIIDSMEPNIHEFFPIEIAMPKRNTYPGNYFTFVVGQYFDAFSSEETRAGSVYEFASGILRPPSSKKGLSGLAVRRSVFGGAHLWRDRAFGPWLTCFSDELEAEIAKAGLRLPKHYQMREI